MATSKQGQQGQARQHPKKKQRHTACRRTWLRRRPTLGTLGWGIQLGTEVAITIAIIRTTLDVVLSEFEMRILALHWALRGMEISLVQAPEKWESSHYQPYIIYPKHMEKCQAHIAHSLGHHGNTHP